MSKFRDVGRSPLRTPAKHALMCEIFGREVGVAAVMPDVDELVWLDLTAGDGVVDDATQDGRPLPWEKNCSPGILAYYARGSLKPITVTMYEIKTATFDRLERNLLTQLPRLGYEYVGDEWVCGNARLRLVNKSGAEADLDNVNERTAVIVSNDPNAITDWAMRKGFAAEIRERTPWFRSISTMGCNVGGIKRMELDERLKWFDLVEEQRERLPSHHDLVLAAIENDAAQWAYLLCEPVKWRSKAASAIQRAFGRHGLSVEFAWLRVEPSRFRSIQERLFLTKRERG